jgi:predicted exporter
MDVATLAELLADLERRTGRLQARAQVLGDVGGEPSQRYLLDAQLTGSCIDEHAVDQVPRSRAARPQLAQHVGRWRLLGACDR